ncbi:MAG: superoxide dismutase [Candidatus Yanofskybacteria bacterium RIFCSPLOWO2_02_FULL_45_10]|uniref:Superoxide dismutase n=2 Tax=Candidatus Yanofskyibacteriota TaxID=1752733 RepID=A0A1F8G1Z5_9BACT|nr:MAG: superoxide dismutase [Candidatus Yanofskybacteria bacterium RIFCSPHIGHO2_12_FULL_45_19b]OGN32104.1 MAG: superoxide dismutase [Candidatus Yanofskybacteria bacterium RIFCSPLOWO2_02_FULL_45_10]
MNKRLLPPLAYAYDALEPYIDAQTMELHHTKHHQTYIDKLNAVLEKYPEIADEPVEELLAELDTLKVEETDRLAIRNHGGGHANHLLFWEIMGPNKVIDQKLVNDINAKFGSTEEFKKQFTDLATKLFGSGWVWLARNRGDGLELYTTANQDSPWLKGHTPLIGLDVWEHAHYLKYQNRRAEYIENWWQVLKLI